MAKETVQHKAPLEGWRKILALIIGTLAIIGAQKINVDPMYVMCLFISYITGQSAIDITGLVKHQLDKKTSRKPKRRSK